MLAGSPGRARLRSSALRVRTAVAAGAALMATAAVLTVLALVSDLVPLGETSLDGLAEQGWSDRNISLARGEQLRVSLTVGSCDLDVYLLTPWEHQAFIRARDELVRILANDPAYRRLPPGEQLRVFSEMLQRTLAERVSLPLDCSRTQGLFAITVSELISVNSRTAAQNYTLAVTFMTRPPQFLPLLIGAVVSGAVGASWIALSLRSNRRRADGERFVRFRP